MTDAREDAAAALPLAGKSVVVTRAAEQSSALAGRLGALGAEVVVVPVIEVVEPEDWAPADAAIRALASYDWIVLTSVNGVETFVARLATLGLPPSALASARVAAVGSATAERLREIGVTPALVPDRSRAEGLVEELRAIGPESGPRVLVPRALEAREVLPDELRALGFVVDVVPVYRVVTAKVEPEALARLVPGGFDAIVFASGGTARRFVDLLTDAGRDARVALSAAAIVSIGPVTTEALHELGLHAAAEARETTTEALADAVVESLAGGSR